MKLPFSLTLAAVLASSSLVPTVAEASHHESRYREDTFRHSRHYRHSHLVRVWVRGHLVRHYGHRHWVRGHYEWRRVYY
jgi:hypothetical protein